MKPNYRATRVACYLGYITQAICVNMPTLLFVTFQREYGISLTKLGLLIAVNFILQIVVDLAATKLGGRLDFRFFTVLAPLCAVLGLAGMAFLPAWLPSPFAGLVIATLLMSLGGGLIEVLISPLVDALPSDTKAADMGLLHSFYCWGIVGVVVLSTLFFAVCGIARWQILLCLWTLPPLVCAGMFCAVPMPPAATAEERRAGLVPLLRQGAFWLMPLLMIASGASEIALSQWASLFAELGLGVSKAVGDLLGPCAFAALMGIARIVVSRRAEHHLERSLALCGIGCVIGYGVIILAPWPLLSLIGFAISGLSVGLMWPGVLSLCSRRYPGGGTAMFALLALSGDIGCTAGPMTVAAVSDARQAAGAPLLGAMQSGFVLALVFPVLLLVCLMLLWKSGKKEG